MKRTHSFLKQVLVAAMGLLLFMSLGTVASRASSRVNNYVYRNHLKPARITYQIDRKLPKMPYRHGTGHPEGVVVHETANPNSNIYGEINFMRNDWKNAFVHAYVDNDHIINVANTKYQAWGVNYPGNARFVQFEQIEVHSKRAFAKEVNNAAYYTAQLLKQYKLSPRDAAYSGKGTVWSHASVAKHLGGSDHTDPVQYYRYSGLRWFGQPYTMHDLYQLVLHYYNDKHQPKLANNNAKPAVKIIKHHEAKVAKRVNRKTNRRTNQNRTRKMNRRGHKFVRRYNKKNSKRNRRNLRNHKKALKSVRRHHQNRRHGRKARRARK